MIWYNSIHLKVFSGLETDLNAANISMRNKIIICLGGNTFIQFDVYSETCAQVCSLFKAFRKLEWRDFYCRILGSI